MRFYLGKNVYLCCYSIYDYCPRLSDHSTDLKKDGRNIYNAFLKTGGSYQITKTTFISPSYIESLRLCNLPREENNVVLIRYKESELSVNDKVVAHNGFFGQNRRLPLTLPAPILYDRFRKSFLPRLPRRIPEETKEGTEP